MRSSLTLVALSFVVCGGLGISACAEGVFVAGGATEDPIDLGRPDLGPPDSGEPLDAGPDDTGPADTGPEDMGAPDMSVCPMGQATCCGDGIIQMNESCDPGIATFSEGRCPIDPETCNLVLGGDLCLEGAGCQTRCVPRNALNPAQRCPPPP